MRLFNRLSAAKADHTSTRLNPVASIQRDASATAFTLLDAVLARRIERDGPKGIMKSAVRMYSQSFEDSILSEIFHRIHPQPQTFVEIGVEDGNECNTRLLLELGWTGLWVEGDPTSAAAARQNFAREIGAGKLKVIEAFVSPENINEVLIDGNVGDNIGFLSVDVDMHTHHIWRAIKTKAEVTCIEYNAGVPPEVDWCVPLDGPEIWAGDNYFGASLKHLETLGRSKSQRLVGCDLMGVNAFFVDQDKAGDHFHERDDAAFHHEPPRFPLAAMPCGHPRAIRR